MADEAQINVSLQIRKTSGSLDLINDSMRGSYNDDVSGTFGPAPGCISVSIHGTDVDLSSFTTPGWAWFWNLDDVNYVEVGAWDPEIMRFFPILEIPPGKGYVVKLSRNVQWEYGSGATTGTGTLDTEVNKLRLRAYNAACDVQVKIFEA